MTEADQTQPEARRTKPKTAHHTRATLESRLTLVVLISVLGGFGLGRVDTPNLLMTLAVLGGLCLVAGSIIALATHWIVTPVRAFADQLDGLAQQHRQTQVSALPTDRDDEVGRMATAVREIMIHRIRDHHDARQLRRTLDDRVRRATRSAVMSLQKMAMRDPMTDLGNRRFLETQLPELIEASAASETDLICLMFDLDNFKQANDTLGHQTGDELIKLLAELIRTSCRDDDLAIRLGGDEFAVFMPGATLERAEQVTAQIRSLFRQRSSVLLGGAVKTDVSIGAASMLEEGCKDGQSLMDQADRHLYRAKRLGKGVTCSLRGTTAA